jgi:hypothetical protein
MLKLYCAANLSIAPTHMRGPMAPARNGWLRAQGVLAANLLIASRRREKRG